MLVCDACGDDMRVQKYSSLGTTIQVDLCMECANELFTLENKVLQDFITKKKERTVVRYVDE